MSYSMVTVDDREPPQLVDELAELSYEVEEEHLTMGDFDTQAAPFQVNQLNNQEANMSQKGIAF